MLIIHNVSYVLYLNFINYELMYVHINSITRLESIILFPNFPKFLPIILFYSHSTRQYHNARVTIYYLHNRLCSLTALIEYLTVLLKKVS